MSEALKYLLEMQDDSKRMVCEIKRLEDLILEADGYSNEDWECCLSPGLSNEVKAIRERRKA